MYSDDDMVQVEHILEARAALVADRIDQGRQRARDWKTDGSISRLTYEPTDSRPTDVF